MASHLAPAGRIANPYEKANWPRFSVVSLIELGGFGDKILSRQEWALGEELHESLSMTWVKIGLKTITWLSFNVGVQALPIFYLWLHRGKEPKAFWEYVNCTLLILIAGSMLFAAISDLVTEGGRVGRFGIASLVAIVGIVIASLHRAIHDEFIKGIRADSELFWGSMVIGVMTIWVSTCIKTTIWCE